MAGKYYPEYDDTARAAATGGGQGRGSVVENEARKASKVDPDMPLANLANVPIYTEIDCPKCSRIVYWIGKKMNFKCFGCDLPPAECPCKPPRKFAKSERTEQVLRG